MFWKLKVEMDKVYEMRLNNPIHITMASLYPILQSSPTVSLYIRHNGKLHLICTLSESNWNVPLNLNFDSTDCKVQFLFVDSFGCVYLSGSENTSSSLNFTKNEIITRHMEVYDLESDTFEDYSLSCIERTIEKKYKRKAKSLPKSKKMKIDKSNNINSDEIRDDEDRSERAVVNKKFITNKKSNKKYNNKKAKNNVEYDEYNEDNNDDEDDDNYDNDDFNNGDNDTTDRDSDLDEEKKKDDDNDDGFDSDDKNENEDTDNSYRITKKKKFPITKYVPVKGKKKILEDGTTIVKVKRGVGSSAKNGQLVHVCITGRWQNGNKQNIFYISRETPPYLKLKVGRARDIGLTGTNKLRIGEIRRIITPHGVITKFKPVGNPPPMFKNSNVIYDIEVKDITDN